MPTICPKHNLERSLDSHCPACLKEYAQRYRSTEKGKSTIRKYEISEKRKSARRKRKMSPVGRFKDRARSLVYEAIHKGKLLKLPCRVCGNSKVEAHHAWSYAEEDALRVVFLCKKHHSLADSNPAFNEEIKSMVPVV